MSREEESRQEEEGVEQASLDIFGENSLKWPKETTTTDGEKTEAGKK